MSVQTDAKFATGDAVECVIQFPDKKTLACAGIVCWMKAESNLLGVQFDSSDRRRQLIKSWIEEYLSM